MGYSPRLYSLSRGKYHECIISPKLDFNIWYIHMLEMAKTTAFWWLSTSFNQSQRYESQVTSFRWKIKLI